MAQALEQPFLLHHMPSMHLPDNAELRCLIKSKTFIINPLVVIVSDVSF
jgi:hypothetical protein